MKTASGTHRSLFGTLVLAAAQTGCTAGGAPSFVLFGAFFPAWLLCAIAGVIVAMLTRVIFAAAGLADVLPFQFFVCSSVGLIVAIGVWLVLFG